MASGLETVGARTTSFFDLPGENRNRVYELLLPKDPLRDHYGHMYKPNGSTKFMAICRQIHHEAAGLLYGARAHDLPIPYLSRVRTLNIRIALSYLRSPSYAQDMLFDIFKHLTIDHEMEINLDIYRLNGGLDLSEAKGITERLEQRVDFNSQLVRGYAEELLYGFFADPIYTIAGAFDDYGSCRITVNFKDCETPRLAKRLGDKRRNHPVSSYKIFKLYFKTLLDIETILDPGLHARYSNSPAGQALAGARIRGDVASLRRCHERVLEYIGNDVEEYRIQKLTFWDQRKGKIKRVENLSRELRKSLPPQHADTSFFGQRLVEQIILDHIRHRQRPV